MSGARNATGAPAESDADNAIYANGRRFHRCRCRWSDGEWRL